MFPSMNAKSVTRPVLEGGVLTTTGFFDLASGPHNMISVPAVVDVSGLEFSIAVVANNLSAGGGLEAGTASAVSVTFSDGGATGDNTTVSALFTAITSTVAFSDTVPRDVTGTSSTDLDADDWVNFHVTGVTSTTGLIGVGLANVNYIYGKPGGIS